MRITQTSLPGVLVIEPRVFRDDRGFFFESWNDTTFSENVGAGVRFVQDNRSRSRCGVLRGLHYQISQPQGKLVMALTGRVFDVAVDIRKSSATFGRWFGTELSESNHRQLWIPPGFAHGFLVLSDVADFFYKVTNYYAPQCERVILWNDPSIGIDWPEDLAPILSPKDQAASVLSEAEVFA